jgi:AcrR family transcriptional regulator
MTIPALTRPSAKDAVLHIFHDLMREKGYGKITVQDILKRAQIGRTTFYTHFTSKEDVLKASINHLRDSLLEAVKREATKTEAVKNETSHKTPLKVSRIKFTFHFFNHILGHHKLYDDIVGRHDFFIVERYFFRMLADLVSRELTASQHTKAQPINIELTTHHLVGAIWSTSIWALERKKLSATAVDEHFQNMAFTGLQNTLKTL